MKIGDIVIVVREGKSYTTHSEMAKELGLKFFKSLEHRLLKNGNVARIVAIKDEFIGIRKDGEDYIISKDGIEILNFAIKIEKFLSEAKIIVESKSYLSENDIIKVARMIQLEELNQPRILYDDNNVCKKCHGSKEIEGFGGCLCDTNNK